MSIQHDSSASDTAEAASEPADDAARAPKSAESPSLPTRLGRAGFPEAPAVPRPRWWVVAVLVAAAALYQAFRTPGVGAWDTVWAEDGANFLNDAANRDPFHAMTTSLNGYFHLYPRLLAEITTLFPVSWWAVVNTSLAIATTCAMAGIVYQCSAGHFRHPAVRLAVAAPIVLQWVANGEAVNSVATLQFAALYTLFWVLVYVARGKLGKIGGPIVAGVIALSTILALVFVPLALVRLYLRRDRTSLWLAVANAGGVLTQVIGLALGRASRGTIGETTPDPHWVIHQLRFVAVPAAVLGEKMTKTVASHSYVWLIAWVLLAAVLLLALRKAMRPAWGLAVLAFGFAIVLFAAEIVAMGSVPHRYLVAPTFLMVTGVVALLRPPVAAPGGDRNGGRRTPLATAPLAAVLVLIAVVAVANYRVPDKTRTPFTPSWTAQVSSGAQQCRANPGLKEVIVLSGPRRMPYGKVHVPCDRLS